MKTLRQELEGLNETLFELKNQYRFCRPEALNAIIARFEESDAQTLELSGFLDAIEHPYSLFPLSPESTIERAVSFYQALMLLQRDFGRVLSLSKESRPYRPYREALGLVEYVACRWVNAYHARF